MNTFVALIIAMAIDEAFRSLLRDFDVSALDADDATILGVWSDLRLGYTNRAWARFAQANGAPELVERWPIGGSIAAAISGPLQSWFRELVTGARSLHPGGMLYQCRSATRQQEFRLTAYPLSGEGLLLVHSLVTESALAETNSLLEVNPDEAAYRNSDGFAVQCSHCQRFRLFADAARWDWIAAWVETAPARTSHGLCSVCASVYYPPLLADY